MKHLHTAERVKTNDKQFNHDNDFKIITVTLSDATVCLHYIFNKMH